MEAAIQCKELGQAGVFTGGSVALSVLFCPEHFRVSSSRRDVLLVALDSQFMRGGLESFPSVDTACNGHVNLDRRVLNIEGPAANTKTINQH